MWKAIKLVIGMLLLSGLGYIYGQYDRNLREAKEERYYSYISFAYPNSDATTVQIKRTPKSQCEKWRNDYFTASSEQCVGCTVLANECRREIRQVYLDAFDQKATPYSYIYKPYKYPEVMVFLGFPEGVFSQLCAMAKDSLETTKCFE
jgi:hypothetical protein